MAAASHRAPETIADGSYTPLSRPLFMYPSVKALKRPEVEAFMDFVVENYQALSDASADRPESEQQANLRPRPPSEADGT